MLVIGVDPGIEKTGIGIVESNNDNLSLIFHKLIKTSSLKPHSERLNEIFEELSEITSIYKPAFASVEKLFFCKECENCTFSF